MDKKDRINTYLATSSHELLAALIKALLKKGVISLDDIEAELSSDDTSA